MGSNFLPDEEEEVNVWGRARDVASGRNNAVNPAFAGSSMYDPRNRTVIGTDPYSGNQWRYDSTTNTLTLNPNGTYYKNLTEEQKARALVPYAYVRDFGDSPVNIAASIDLLLQKFKSEGKDKILLKKLSAATGKNFIAYGDANFRTSLIGVLGEVTGANWFAAGEAKSGSTGKQLSILEYLDMAIASGGGSGSTPVTSVSYTGKQTAWDLFSNLTSQLAGARPSRSDFDEFYKKLHAKESTYKSVSTGGSYQTDTNNKLDVQDFAINYIVKKLDLSDPELSGAANQSKQRIDQLMRDNGVDKYFTAGTKAKFIRNLLTGDVTEADIQDSIRKQAMNTYTQWAQDMKDNPELAFSDIIRPYAEQYQQTLELSGPVDISDVASLAANGQEKVSAFDFQKRLRDDQRWTTTKQANMEASDLAKSFAKAFGVNV